MRKAVPKTLRRRRVVGVAAIGVLLALAVVGLWSLDVRAETGLPLGAHDFVQHSAAFDVATEGGNPYDFESLREAEESLHSRYEQEPQRFWYPPYVLVVLAPVVALPFELATAAWFVLTFAGAVVLVLLSWRLFNPQSWQVPPVVVGFGLLFVPLIECLSLGQLGVLVALLVIGGMLALRAGADGVAGTLLALTMIRPQTVLLPLLVLGVHVVATGRWRVVRAGLLTAGGIVLTSVIAFPNVWAAWDPIGGSPTHFRTPTIASWLRGWIHTGSGEAPTWPLLAVPAVGLLLTIPWALRHRESVEWTQMPLVLGFSLLVAPYAWVYDAMLLLPIHVLAISTLLRRRSHTWAFGAFAVLLQVAVLLLGTLPSMTHEHRIAIPLAMVVLHGAMLSTARDSDRTRERL